MVLVLLEYLEPLREPPHVGQARVRVGQAADPEGVDGHGRQQGRVPLAPPAVLAEVDVSVEAFVEARLVFGVLPDVVPSPLDFLPVAVPYRNEQIGPHGRLGVLDVLRLVLAVAGVLVDAPVLGHGPAGEQAEARAVYGGRREVQRAGPAGDPELVGLARVAALGVLRRAPLVGGNMVRGEREEEGR